MDEDKASFPSTTNKSSSSSNSKSKHRFLVVGSPPGTGKTALSQLIQAQLVESNKADTGGKIPGYYIRPSEVGATIAAGGRAVVAAAVLITHRRRHALYFVVVHVLLVAGSATSRGGSAY